jgi:hypothetical protein
VSPAGPARVSSSSTRIGRDLAGPLAVSVLAGIGATMLFAAAQRTNPVTAQDV